MVYSLHPRTYLQPTWLLLHTAPHTVSHFPLRYSSPLFRLSSPEDVLHQVSFTNTGPDQVPGVIVMQIASAEEGSGGGGVYDPAFRRIVVVFNCSPLAQTVAAPPLPSGAKDLVLHPLQAAFGYDEQMRSGCKVEAGSGLMVAARTTAIFVEPR